MFDNNQDSGAPLPEMSGDFGAKKSFFQKIFSKSETAIPIILIVILLIVLVFAFSGWDYSQVPLIGGTLQTLFGAKTYQVLIIGQPLPQTKDTIYGNRDFEKYYNFVPRTADELGESPETVLKHYDFVILDQSNSTTQMGALKAIPRQLAEALKSYVASGHSMIIVGNSAHLEAHFPDAYGWKRMFGDIVPVDCTENTSILSPCEEGSARPIPAVIYTTGSNPLSSDTVKIPSQAFQLTGQPYLELTVYPVNQFGDEWAYIKDVRTKDTYTGIVAQGNILGGKVVYISYPEYYLTPDLMQRIFEYVR